MAILFVFHLQLDVQTLTFSNEEMNLPSRPHYPFPHFILHSFSFFNLIFVLVRAFSQIISAINSYSFSPVLSGGRMCKQEARIIFLPASQKEKFKRENYKTGTISKCNKAMKIQCNFVSLYFDL
jgi:hypothetical protein